MGKRKRSGCDKLIDGVQYQHMQGVEGVAKVLEPPGVVTLPAPVEPDGEEGEEGQALLDELAKADPDRSYIKTVWGIGFKLAEA